MATPRPSRAFDLVVFDLGGVLVRIADSWAEAHSLAGLPPHPIVTDATFEAARIRLGKAHQDGSLPSADYYRLKAEASGGVYSPADVERIIEAWTREEYAGVGAVLDAQEAAGVAIAALSNTNPVHWQRLDGTAEYPTVARIPRRFASHLLRRLKPDPEAYAAVASATGIEARRILFFDDGPANVHAARLAGWAAEPVDPHGDTASQLRGHLATHGVVQTGD